MIKLKETKIVTDKEERIFNVRPDIVDIRDRMYEPELIPLKPELDNRKDGMILNQGPEGACTGFAVAAVINHLNADRENNFQASPRMLYEMARMHDKWPGEDYSGSSVRGAIQGWRNMGVCSDASWEYEANKQGELTVERAIDARNNTLGAYYRLRPEISEYHAALNEVGAICVSAAVHNGWQKPQGRRNSRISVIIPAQSKPAGHAFAIVGYNTDGFIVQNSWGPHWGTDGYALWTYEDWLTNISDGWVFRLALPTPSIFQKPTGKSQRASFSLFKSKTKRTEIAGHFAHFDDGNFDGHGRYWTKLNDIMETAKKIKESNKKDPGRYKHLVLYAHGGLNDPSMAASRIAQMKDGFKRNGIYPFHMMYDTGLKEELKDIIFKAHKNSEDRANGFLDWIGDTVTGMTDKLIEEASRKLGTAVWDEMKRDASTPFASGKDGVKLLEILAKMLSNTGIRVHLIGHSAGSVLQGHLLNATDKISDFPTVDSAHLMAPACTIDFYKQNYEHRLKQSASKLDLHIYNLTTELEEDDNVFEIYRKSLAILISKAFERGKDVKLLGLQKYSRGLDGPTFRYSNGKTGPTRSESHGGFDNDEFTLNSILENILGHEPEKPFTKKELASD